MPSLERPLERGDYVLAYYTRRREVRCTYVVLGYTSRGKVRLMRLDRRSVFTAWWETYLPAYYERGGKMDEATLREIERQEGL